MATRYRVLAALLATLTLIVAASIGSGPALAGKPGPVIEWSNGFPSGPHFNLNIHGKKPGYACDPSPGGGSVFVPEYGNDQIDFVQNKRASLTELIAKDPCGATFDNDPVLVQLPAGEYQVYARILAKPSKTTQRSVVFYPKLIETCNDSGDPAFPDEVSCDNSFLLGTGVVTGGGFFDANSGTFTRQAGNSKAVEITAAFTWTGYACDQSLDATGDGFLTFKDFPGLATEEELRLHLATLVGAGCTHFDSEWVFNIADLVVYGWDYTNTGSKLLQVRFYPKDTTTFD